MKRFGLLLTSLLIAGCPSKEEPKKPPAAATDQAASTQPATPGEKPMMNPHGDEFENLGPPGKPISGLVKLGEGISESDVKPTDVLFVMVRESQGGGKFGRLVAVQRYGQVQFPKRYEIGASDVMVPGIPFKGPFIVMARLDRDGDPMTRKPEDLYAVVAKEVMNGDEGVHLVLEKSTVKDVAPPEGAAPPMEKQPATQPAGHP